jgi:hypothetical protein
MKYRYHIDGCYPNLSEIFVFGSNQAGIHGAGAARYAHDRLGAELGVGEGITGKCYAIPTKDFRIHTLPLPAVKEAVDRFKAHAAAHPKVKFFMTRVGCGLAGYTDEDIAPMFAGSPTNINFPAPWAGVLEAL